MAQETVEQVAGRLLLAFRAAVPLPAELMKGKKKPSQAEIRQRVEAGLAGFYETAKGERARLRLGLIKRARVAFHLQNHLLAAGYDPALVKQVLFAMLVSAFIGR